MRQDIGQRIDKLAFAARRIHHSTGGNTNQVAAYGRLSEDRWSWWPRANKNCGAAVPWGRDEWLQRQGVAAVVTRYVNE